MPKSSTVKGHIVHYEENAYQGIQYLINDLDHREAEVFFSQARMKGYAEFEDDHERQFTLLHQNGAYTLVRR